MNISKYLRILSIFIAAVVSMFLMSTSFLPQSTGGSQTYIADIFCTPNTRAIHCQGKTTENKRGNPCINPPMDCLTNRSKVETSYVDLYGASSYSRPNSLLQLQGSFVTSSFRASVLQVNLLNSILTTLLAFGGFYLLRSRGKSSAVVPVFSVFWLIPALFFQIGSVAPAGLGTIGFLVFLLCLHQICETPQVNSSSACKLVGILSFSSWLLCTTRFDYLVFGIITVLIFLTLLTVHNLRTFSAKIGIRLVSFVVVLGVLLTQIPKRNTTEAQRLAIAVVGKIELSESTEVKILTAKGIIQDGGMRQRIWYLITAPIYYLQDFVAMTEIKMSHYVSGVLIFSICILLLIISMQALKKFNPRELSSQVGMFLLLGALLMPAYVETGHVRLRYIAPLVIGAILLACISEKGTSAPMMLKSKVPIAVSVWGIPVVFLVLQVEQREIVWEALSVPNVAVVTVFGICHLFLVFTIFSLDHSKFLNSLSGKHFGKNLLTDRLEKYV